MKKGTIGTIFDLIGADCSFMFSIVKFVSPGDYKVGLIWLFIGAMWLRNGVTGVMEQS